MDDLYLVLGIDPDEKPDAIQERFRFLAQAYHPDKFSSQKQKELAEEEFKKINYAYQILSNPTKRADYDLRRRNTANYSKTNTANVNRNAEEAARQRSQADQNRKTEEAIRQRLREEQTRNAKEATRLHMWEEKLRKEEESARQREKFEQMRKAEETQRQRIKDEQKRKITEAVRQRALIKQNEKNDLLELCLKHHLILKNGDYYIINPSGSKFDVLMAMPHVNYTREHAHEWDRDIKERKRKLNTFLRGFIKTEEKKRHQDNEQKILDQSINAKTVSKKDMAGDLLLITVAEMVKAWKQITYSVMGESVNLAALLNSVKAIDVQGRTVVLYFASEIVKSKMKTEEKERTSAAIYDLLGIS